MNFSWTKVMGKELIIFIVLIFILFGMIFNQQNRINNVLKINR